MTLEIVSQVAFREVNALPAAHDILPGELLALSLSARTDELTHGIHRFSAKFVPQIPRWAIAEYTRSGDRVLDPFAGSGTTLLEALACGRESIGFDTDPLARLISRAKTTPIDPGRLRSLFAKLRLDVPRRTQLEVPMDGVRHFEHWFTRDAWGKLESLRKQIGELPGTIEEREFFLVVFSSIVRLVSNADDQSQKTYVSGTHLKKPPDVFETFARNMTRAIARMDALVSAVGLVNAPSIPDDGNALTMALPLQTVDLIITSPPYLDSVDYMYNFMLEYFWLGPTLGVPTRQAFNAMRRSPIGAKNPAVGGLTMPPELRGIVDLREVATIRKAATSAYFRAMRLHLRLAAQALRPGGHYVLVIGNSQTGGKPVAIHNAMVALAHAQGLALERAFAYRVRRHYMKFPRKARGGIIVLDWVLTFRREDGLSSVGEQLPIHWLTADPDEVAY